MLSDWIDAQVALCNKHGVVPVPVTADQKLGIARNVRSGLLPINGVRLLPERGTCGWYIWAGEGEQTSEDPNFYEPLHVAHVEDWCAAVMPFLLLPPGWRFLTDGDYVDVWFDPDVDLTPS